jgi:hypothetical protein
MESLASLYQVLCFDIQRMLVHEDSPANFVRDIERKDDQLIQVSNYSL